jgi:hypothetical protein
MTYFELICVMLACSFVVVLCMVIEMRCANGR